jgi:hypothetical protein
MQHLIMQYVEDLKLTIASRSALTPGGDLSIADALTHVLPGYSKTTIQKLREAAADLERILVLEFGQRAEREEEDHTLVIRDAVAHDRLLQVLALATGRCDEDQTHEALLEEQLLADVDAERDADADIYE